MAWDKADIPALKEYYAWMKSRPNLKAYQESDRCPRTWSLHIYVICRMKSYAAYVSCFSSLSSVRWGLNDVNRQEM